LRILTHFVVRIKLSIRTLSPVAWRLQLSDCGTGMTPQPDLRTRATLKAMALKQTARISVPMRV
jgi:hypothetical protein